MPYHALAGILVVCSVLLGTCVGCSEPQKSRGQGHLRVKNENQMARICKVILGVEDYSKQDAPTEMAALVNWLDEIYLTGTSFEGIDASRKTMWDLWGRELVLIVENDVLVGLGTCGKNGIWEDGHGDDQILKIDRSYRQAEE